MKKILSAALALSMIASAGAAAAQPHDRGHQSQNYDRRDDRRDNRQDAKQERRDDRAWAKYERKSAKRYAAARYQRPSGYQQRQWRHGERLPASYRSRAYVVDYNRYNLAPPPRGYQYTRVDNDVVMTAVASGIIASVIVGMFQ